MGTKGLTRGSAPSTPKRSRVDARKIAGDGFAAMANRRFADRRRTAMGANGDEVPEAAPALRRADTGAETRGSKGGGASPCQTATLNVAWAGLRTLLRA